MTERACIEPVQRWFMDNKSIARNMEIFTSRFYTCSEQEDGPIQHIHHQKKKKTPELSALTEW